MTSAHRACGAASHSLHPAPHTTSILIRFRNASIQRRMPTGRNNNKLPFVILANPSDQTSPFLRQAHLTVVLHADHISKTLHDLCARRPPLRGV